MADIKQDLLSLQYSQSFSVEGMQEADINLSLPPASLTSASVYGVVLDGVTPVADATVKLFDSAGQPYQHTLTDAAGAFSMDGIPAGTYSLAAVKTGYTLSDAAGVTLTSGVASEINLALTADATLALGTIAGVVTVTDLQGIRQPLGGAKVTLNNALGETVASTYTADDGEFAFYDLADGVYTLLTSATGYQAVAPMTATILNGSIANVELGMTVDTRTYNGTVSGVIRDSDGNAVANCFVGLYAVTQDLTGTHETLVATTKTITAGQYLFGQVDGGQYMVKAKKEQ